MTTGHTNTIHDISILTAQIVNKYLAKQMKNEKIFIDNLLNWVLLILNCITYVDETTTWCHLKIWIFLTWNCFINSKKCSIVFAGTWMSCYTTYRTCIWYIGVLLSYLIWWLFCLWCERSGNTSGENSRNYASMCNWVMLCKKKLSDDRSLCKLNQLDMESKHRVFYDWISQNHNWCACSL